MGAASFAQASSEAVSFAQASSEAVSFAQASSEAVSLAQASSEAVSFPQARLDAAPLASAPGDAPAFVPASARMRLAIATVSVGASGSQPIRVGGCRALLEIPRWTADDVADRPRAHGPHRSGTTPNSLWSACPRAACRRSRLELLATGVD